MTARTKSSDKNTTHRGPISARMIALFATVVVTALVIGAIIVGRSLVGSHYVQTKSYQNAGAIPAANGLFVLPDWAPADATNIAIKVQTQGKGRSLTFSTESKGVPRGCVATPHPKTDPTPGLDLSETADQSAGYRCAEWFVVRDARTVYAWTAYRSS